VIPRPASLSCLLLWAALLLAPVSAEALPGRILIGTGGGGIDLFVPRDGTVRQVAEEAGEPAFLPGDRSFAYIRAGGCFPIAKGCYTLYSIFEKSLARWQPAAPGRQVFGWKRFFVRSVDAAPNGRLVISAKLRPGPSRGGREMEIFSAAPDGSQVRRLTHNRVFENDAVVSPNGRLIAFSRRVRGRGQIFVMRSDGSHVRRLTRGRGRNRLPDWSPDGRRLVFISQPPASSGFGDREIYTLPLDGYPKRRLTSNRVVENRPVYSPDGRWIAFERDGNLWAMRADGAVPRLILRHREEPGFEAGIDWGR
jgi:Tol biopolymer transport system component